MVINDFTKKEAIRIVTSAAKDYQDVLSGMNYVFIYRERPDNSIGFFETIFLPRNFQHLTGLELLDEKGEVDKRPLLLYERCVGRLINTLLLAGDNLYSDSSHIYGLQLSTAVLPSSAGCPSEWTLSPKSSSGVMYDW